jgi:L-aminopeptidase/D-esterase-like protein
VGAGAGATVGKLLGGQRAMKGGIGSWAIRLEDGTIVAALVAVNTVGNIVDPKTGKQIAGCLTEDRRGIVAAGEIIRSRRPRGSFSGENTTLGLIVTNAVLNQSQATKVAQMAQDGLARAITPAHTPVDGDTVYAAATGGHQSNVDLLTLGALAAEAMSEAILRAVENAESVAGILSFKELNERR